MWTHKKKAALALVLGVYGVKWIRHSNKDQRIRTYYAREAKKYGQLPIAPIGRLRRVTVLVNREANQRKALDLFNKNALPLLNLAAIDVSIIKVGELGGEYSSS